MLEMNLASSRALAGILVSAHAASALLLGLTGLPWMGKVAALPVFLASLALSLRRHAWRLSPSAVVGVRLDRECRAAFRRLDGKTLEGTLHGSSFVSPWLTVLNLSPEGRWRTVSLVILPDAVEREAFRQLRVLLRWKCAQVRPG